MKITCIHGQNHRGSTYHIGKLLAEQFVNSEKNRIMQAVEGADLLIFTTPTYCMHASASMKAFIDLTFTYWMSHRPRACMFSKKAVVISTAAGTGTKSAIKDWGSGESEKEYWKKNGWLDKKRPWK